MKKNNLRSGFFTTDITLTGLILIVLTILAINVISKIEKEVSQNKEKVFSLLKVSDE